MSGDTPRQDDNRALIVLLSVIFLNIAGFGLVIPLLPFFGKALDAPAWQIAILFSAYSFGQFLGEPFWGRMSDRVGRRPVLMITIAGGALSYVALAFAPTIWLAFTARFVGGFLSGNISTLQGALADITRPEERAGKMGLMGSAFSLGFMIGPAIGGLLAHPELGPLGFQIPLFAAAGFGLASAAAVAIFVRESRPEPKTGARVPQIEALREAFAHPVIARVMIISFITVSGFAGIEATYGLWTEQRFGWGPRQIGFAFMAIGVLGAYCQAILTGRLVRRHGEPRVLTAGLVAMWIGMGFQFFSPTWHVAMIGFAFVCFGQSICFPCLTALISQATPPDRQGEFLGLNMSNMALARIGGPIYAGQLFSLVNPGAAFVVTAILIMPATALALQIMRRTLRAA
ncbi:MULTISPECIES: MFS transporter [Phenylobacterium]|uniref:MFS family permease n=1 Tax=Phenylobacterium koreense TaxID=266125 RepID=A0ABV2EG07_9CAUL